LKTADDEGELSSSRMAALPHHCGVQPTFPIANYQDCHALVTLSLSLSLSLKSQHTFTRVKQTTALISISLSAALAHRFLGNNSKNS